MGGIISGEEYLTKIDSKWYKIKCSHQYQADKFFEQFPNPDLHELPWYITFISEEK